MRRDKDDPIQPKKQKELLARILRLLGYPPSLNLPVDIGPLGAYQTVSRWPEGYRLDSNGNSFFAIQMKKRDVMSKDSRPFKIPERWNELLHFINEDLDERWLVQKGAAGVLMENDKGERVFQSPIIFGKNPVKVLRIIKDRRAEIQVLNVIDAPPTESQLRDWMVQNCGFARDVNRFRARMLTLFDQDTAFIDLPLIRKV